MNHLFGKACLMAAFLPLFAGCATNIGVPQTRDEFVTMYKPGGLFRNVEHVTVNRPGKAVVADVKEYAKKCLTVRVTSGPNYRLKEVGGSTTYHPKIETARKDVTTLSVQEEYNDRAQSGVPKGGIFTLVAEIGSAGKNKTRVDIYHAGRGKIADPLKEWIDGDKHSCPSLERGW
jgi:hypothetical protein